MHTGQMTADEFINFIKQLTDEGHTGILEGTYCIASLKSPYGYDIWIKEPFKGFRL